MEAVHFSPFGALAVAQGPLTMNALLCTLATFRLLPDRAIVDLRKRHRQLEEVFGAPRVNAMDGCKGDGDREARLPDGHPVNDRRCG